ncbi:MAG: T9SS type A sorting domain-containing protein, partial [Candidatus Bipolaricaulota bacterium]|nr:T9SS type A sorting domain-containing protein [Candidatus Bipolaricaulota bacterium]MDW8141815.1 hypothetical protein [Candidatus Bipolaricaulota bacterium]
LASQCGTNPIIGQPTSALGLVLNVLSGHAGAASVQATVYSLTGRRLLEQKASGTQIALELAKPKLANGVYLVVITSLGPDGRVLAREVRKVVILR